MPDIQILEMTKMSFLSSSPSWAFFQVIMLDFKLKCKASALGAESPYFARITELPAFVAIAILFRWSYKGQAATAE